jgi:hypothetical protein
MEYKAAESTGSWRSSKVVAHHVHTRENASPAKDGFPKPNVAAFD